MDINAQFSINNLAKSQEKKKVFILIVSCRCANNTLKDIASHRKELLLCNIGKTIYSHFHCRRGRDCMAVGFTTTYAISACRN